MKKKKSFSFQQRFGVMFGKLSKSEIFFITIIGSLAGAYIYTPIILDLKKKQSIQNNQETDLKETKGDSSK